MQTLQCKSCGAAMGEASFDRRLGVVVCDHCGAIFDLTRQSDRDAATSASSPAPSRPELVAPNSTSSRPP